MCKILPYGDGAIHVQFHEEICEEGFTAVQTFFRRLTALKDRRILELIPTYHSVTVFYRPGVSYQEMLELIHSVWQSYDQNSEQSTSVREVIIPVCYGGEYGPDLEFVAQYHNLSVNEVINKHSESQYLVYMIGFMPGFPYMGGLNLELATPRLSSPRAVVPQGSVGIAGQQTGLYPLTSPGGWQLIGRTPLTLFDVNSDPPTLLRSGDRVRFKPISSEEYNKLRGNET